MLTIEFKFRGEKPGFAVQYPLNGRVMVVHGSLSVEEMGAVFKLAEASGYDFVASDLTYPLRIRSDDLLPQISFVFCRKADFPEIKTEINADAEKVSEANAGCGWARSTYVGGSSLYLVSLTRESACTRVHDVSPLYPSDHESVWRCVFAFDWLSLSVEDLRQAAERDPEWLPWVGLWPEIVRAFDKQEDLSRFAIRGETRGHPIRVKLDDKGEIELGSDDVEKLNKGLNDLLKEGLGLGEI